MHRLRIAAVAVLLATSGCGGITIPEDPPLQEGVITERDRQPSFGTRNPTILVKNQADDPCGILYVVDPDNTDVWARTSAGKAEEKPVSDLRIGVHVRVWSYYISGICLGEGQASSIEILPG